MDSWNETACRLEELMPLIRERLAAGQKVRFFPRGVSMLPMLRQGQDQVVLSPLPARLRKYDIVLYQRDNGQYVLHRIVKCGETYTFLGDNQFARERGLRREQMIAILTGFTRGQREFPVTDVRYRIYCRVWHYTRPFRRVWRGIRRRL